LVTERFAAARRHDDQRVVAVHDGLDDALLSFEKFAETEMLVEQAVELFAVGHARILVRK
jgi:hypothetical protein